MRLTPDGPIGKEQFLIEHNRLSPSNLQATFSLLTRFQKEKKPLLKDADWSNKLRIPFISWLISLPEKSAGNEEDAKKPENREYKIYIS